MANSSLYNLLIDSKKKKGGRIPYNNSAFDMLAAKGPFLIAVFMNLFAQLGITYYTMEKTPNASKYNMWLLIILTFIFLIILTLVPMPWPLKLVIFAGFSYVWGLLLANIKNKKNDKQIRLAIEGALSVFAAMFVAGLALLIGGIELGFTFGLILFVILIILFITRLITQFSGNMPKWHKFLAIIGILLFSAFVLYDTNIILQRNYDGDFVTASMDYYLDILNLFLNILDVEN